MGFKRSQLRASARPSLLMYPHWGKGEEVEGQLELMLPTHFIFRPDLLLLHQRLETEREYFCIYLAMPSLCVRHVGVQAGKVAGRILQLEVVHSSYLYLISFSRHLFRDIYKGSYFDQL